MGTKYGPLNLHPNTSYIPYTKSSIEQSPPEAKGPITRARRKTLRCIELRLFGRQRCFEECLRWFLEFFGCAARRPTFQNAALEALRGHMMSHGRVLT